MEPVLTKLSNNLSVITERVEGVNSVGINLWVKVGSRHEVYEKIGLAHFLEHMAFKGTNTRSALDIAKIFDAIGGNFNAYTDKEHTVYHLKVMKKDVGTALDVLADLVLESAFPEDELMREKDVVLQEIYQTNDSPSSIIFDKYMEAAYEGQIFGKSILGSVQTVQNFSKEDLVAHMDEHYFGSNMILSIAGDISHDAVLEMSAGFAKIKDGTHKHVSAPEYTGGQYLEQRDLEQVHVVLGFPGVSYNDKRYHALQVLDTILGSGLSSRLFQEVREKLGLVYSIYSFNSNYSDCGIFSIHAATESSKLPALLKTVTSEIRRMPNTIESDELERAKSKLESEILMSRESPVARSDAIGYCYSNYGRYITKEELIENIRSIGEKEVQEAGNWLLSNSEKITLAAIGKLDGLASRDDVVAMLS
ncbi:M16 family metallopeptidase [Candidatus Anaplasma sp. TIGMIC]|uniref:M16 family metallopeptidase n=1 Tax=Candidatus Anaplasma sp. TIGMIC TaxID=3020713 RepID=UPI00232E8495|nr:pitrilysin family protein [Candidatus Anaplasma sp. TIGMIC]MDB1135572.1 pitrilysin family protein [Candidatus Anaplasma sp. TIGMIC]